MYKLLTHNDLDGVGCGILAKLAFGNDVKVRYNSVSALDREVERFLEDDSKETHLLITDLSVNEANEKRLESFYKDNGKVQLIDHHKTALSLNNYEWGQVIVEDEEGKLTSATSLLYEYLIDQQQLNPTNAITEFVELVRQYDTWEWEKNNNQRARRLNALFYLISIEEFEEKMIQRLQIEDGFSFDEFEKKLLDMEDDKIERYIRRKRRELVQSRIGDHFAGIVYAESYHSELGNELGKEYPHLDYIAIVNIGGKRLGFRTIHDHIDLSEVAGQFGGGGHAKASGCSLTDETYKQFVMDTFHLEPLREDARYNRFNLKQSTFGSLYQDRSEHIYLLHLLTNQEWAIDENGVQLDQTFTSYEEGESFLKRKHAAWLVKDEVFVNYLMNEVKMKGDLV
ncbi:oligoribonuclease NrnB/cAMP/cGMP phosphodiesterase (DHH superfamily) [Cytobacillus eiseniae]|uniref:Oligoribonuclease NrnB/cAMP/cGMP phosphodiesterase (DHH superfamily) n=1 Tax=Cytobacillus eiseniae TaxID=762947 RepID=A0ABS4RAW5_9BACI|nr:oligoribonuclease [Cytobacillus eiseniae]MBP2239516.1 oligoribonuclease NrnB/cAMP/cGMP phosphodiesterase (DHH superfamily) [Cytobacillus eiseniae]